MEKTGPETKAAHLFQQGQYTEALQLYTTCINAIPSPARQDIKVNLLLNRSACYLKLKKFDKVVDDCTTILSIDASNGKALGRKIKALSILGKFGEAQTLARHWISRDPQNEQAKKELKRIEIIINTLKDQEGEEDGLYEPGSPTTGERIPPEGREADLTGLLPVQQTAGSLPAFLLSAMASAASGSSSTTPSSTPDTSPVHTHNVVSGPSPVHSTTAARAANIHNVIGGPIASSVHNKIGGPLSSTVYKTVGGLPVSAVHNLMGGPAASAVHNSIVGPASPAIGVASVHNTLSAPTSSGEVRTGFSSAVTAKPTPSAAAPSLSLTANHTQTPGAFNHVGGSPVTGALSSDTRSEAVSLSHSCVMCDKSFPTVDLLTQHTHDKHRPVISGTTNESIEEEDSKKKKVPTATLR